MGSQDARVQGELMPLVLWLYADHPGLVEGYGRIHHRNIRQYRFCLCCGMLGDADFGSLRMSEYGYGKSAFYIGSQAHSKEPFGHTALIDPALEEVSSPPPRITVTSLQFSNNGIYILVGTSSDVHYLYDAYDLRPIRRLTGHRPLAKASGEELSFTADSRFVLSGSVEGAVYFWDLGKDKLDAAPKDARGGSMAAKTLKADVVIQPSGLGVTGPSRAVKFNPRLCVMAVGGEELVSASRTCQGSWIDTISLSGCLLQTKRPRLRRGGRSQDPSCGLYRVESPHTLQSPFTPRPVV